jgi:hypothetical protein
MKRISTAIRPSAIRFKVTAPENRNGPSLDNGSVNTFPRQRIDAVTDEMFEMVVSIRFT